MATLPGAAWTGYFCFLYKKCWIYKASVVVLLKVHDEVLVCPVSLFCNGKKEFMFLFSEEGKVWFSPCHVVSSSNHFKSAVLYKFVAVHLVKVVFKGHFLFAEARVKTKY